jgi:hypothetical protein
VFIDEADSAMAIPAVRKEVDSIATKGREYGVGLTRAGQRGTTDYGSAKTRSQDDVFVIGKVNRQGEVYHAAGSMGFSLPDMATYGEGHSGVWAVAELGGGHRTGRAWLFTPTDAARIAAERAFDQPELPPACREFLGESYEVLLSTDVFAKWAAEQAGREPVPVAVTPRDSHARAEHETSEPSLNAFSAAEQAALKDLDFPVDIDDETRAKLAAIDAKNANTRRILDETARRPKSPEVSKEAMDAHTAARWKQAAEQTEIPDAIRARLLELCAGEGMSGRKITDGLGEGIKRTDVMWWLHKLRHEGLIESAGKGPSARWRRVVKDTGGDGQ